MLPLLYFVFTNCFLLQITEGQSCRIGRLSFSAKYFSLPSLELILITLSSSLNCLIRKVANMKQFDCFEVDINLSCLRRGGQSNRGWNRFVSCFSANFPLGFGVWENVSTASKAFSDLLKMLTQISKTVQIHSQVCDWIVVKIRGRNDRFERAFTEQKLGNSRRHIYGSISLSTSQFRLFAQKSVASQNFDILCRLGEVPFVAVGIVT